MSFFRSIIVGFGAGIGFAMASVLLQIAVAVCVMFGITIPGITIGG